MTPVTSTVAVKLLPSEDFFVSEIFTVAIFLSEVSAEKVPVVLPAVAVTVPLLPGIMLKVLLSNFRVFSCTVMVHTAVRELSFSFTVRMATPAFLPVTVMVAVPSFKAPMETEATSVLSNVYSSVPSLEPAASLLPIIALISALALGARERLLWLKERVRLSVFFITVTVHTAVIAGFSTEATVICAVPSFFAVTVPLLSTVATSVLEEVQVTALLPASSGATVAFKEATPPSASVREVLSREMLLTSTFFSVTLIWQLPVKFSVLLALFPEGSVS